MNIIVWYFDGAILFGFHSIIVLFVYDFNIVIFQAEIFNRHVQTLVEMGFKVCMSVC